MVAQWVKDLTAVAQVTEEAQVWSPAQHSGLKDPALPQLWCNHKIKKKKKKANNNYWCGCQEIEILIYSWWDCKMV